LADDDRDPAGQPALYRAHRVLIGAAVVLGVILGAWGIWDAQSRGNAQSLWVGAASFVVAALLGVYLWRFNRRTRS